MEFTKEEQEYLDWYEKKYHILTDSQKEYVIKFYREPVAFDEVVEMIDDFFDDDKSKKSS